MSWNFVISGVNSGDHHPWVGKGTPGHYVFPVKSP